MPIKINISRDLCFISVLFILIFFVPLQLQKEYVLLVKLFLLGFFCYLLPERKEAPGFFGLSDWPVWLFIICLCACLIPISKKDLALWRYLDLSINMFFLFYIGKALARKDEDRGLVIAVFLLCGGLAALRAGQIILILIAAAFIYLLANKRYKSVVSVFIILMLLLGIRYFLPVLFKQEIPYPYHGLQIEMSWQIFKDYPLVGVGLERYRYVFEQYYPFNRGMSSKALSNNMYITLLIETGIIGLSGFIVLISALFQRGIRGFIRITEVNKKQALLAAMLILVTILIEMSGDELFYRSNFYMFFCLLCGFIMGTSKSEGGILGKYSLNLSRRKVVIGLVSLFAVFAGLVSLLWILTPDIIWLKDKNPSEITLMRIRKSEAAKLGKPYFIRWQYVSLDKISQNLVEAVIISEDRNFFDHKGFDWESLDWSLRMAVAKKKFTSGASTITEQLAKNLFLNPSKSVLRKIRGMIIAYKMERALSKNRILELYLNIVEWGDGIYGAEAAAQTYFHKPVSDLTMPEAIRLAVILPNPHIFTVLDHSQRIVEKRANITRKLYFKKLVDQKDLARILGEVNR